MLTYRGTNNGVTGKQDWKTNLMQGMGKETDQYNQAMELAEKTQRAVGDDFSIVGHSLGGGLASSGVAVTGQPGYTFNAAGLHPDTPARKGGLSLEETSKLIQTQSVKGEVLTLAQENANTAITGGLTALGNKLGGPVGASIGLAIGSFLVPKVPEAVGSKRDLPGSGMNPVARHGMDQVIDGIESQKKEDIKTLLSG
ncbi:Mbeg1-like protein [Oceanospirillum beijerinckii]|uniref:Mbeg1-like protein n=1 Tax=Oceanospirillum beijerinckii TaxID=64976 RepID=UPI0003FEB45F|nr:Mbeg1-like protein [Oceanospirillum beijerinckii]